MDRSVSMKAESYDTGCNMRKYFILTLWLDTSYSVLFAYWGVRDIFHSQVKFLIKTEGRTLCTMSLREIVCTCRDS